MSQGDHWRCTYLPKSHSDVGRLELIPLRPSTSTVTTRERITGYSLLYEGAMNNNTKRAEIRRANAPFFHVGLLRLYVTHNNSKSATPPVLEPCCPHGQFHALFELDGALLLVLGGHEVV